ncbi:Hypothetical predicted protein [Marmota monax]|uniref:Homeobox domain-containing protein n=1 Tax=Marmota monax TaxID=9995 RepID=A0A5E4BE01_MARMO|nr:hypothetical protein GHT09_012703 [Marmota monax]VTJ67974.1 Hypothetical predicted protein [Marmota monax]
MLSGSTPHPLPVRGTRICPPHQPRVLFRPHLTCPGRAVLQTHQVAAVPRRGPWSVSPDPAFLQLPPSSRERSGPGCSGAAGCSHLCLSLLAQVKVWFQNRRTKYKRQKLEEEGPESEQKKKGSHHINRWRIATKQANGEDIDVTSND